MIVSVVSTGKLLLLCLATVVHDWVLSSDGGHDGSVAAAGTVAVSSCSC